MGETQHTYKGSCRLERLCPELRIPESGHCLKRLAMGAHLIRVSLYAVESTACNATTIRLARLFCNVVLLKIKDKRRVKKILMGAKSGQKSTFKRLDSTLCSAPLETHSKRFYWSSSSTFVCRICLYLFKHARNMSLYRARPTPCLYVPKFSPTLASRAAGAY
jgi:hypothetical protein